MSFFFLTTIFLSGAEILQIEVESALVIFDEAHNIEDVCREALSLHTTRETLKHVSFFEKSRKEKKGGKGRKKEEVPFPFFRGGNVSHVFFSFFFISLNGKHALLLCRLYWNAKLWENGVFSANRISV
mmetsp:Transcript_5971/g.14352  ORF Transcript_5971/g.14352 Transcript_5971/m.14352 type:complete len:128 (+) Transcript_5971:2313-2696(+)